MDSLTGETLATLGGLQMQASSSFLAGLNSCPTFVDKSTLLQARDCGWGGSLVATPTRTARVPIWATALGGLTTLVGGQKEIADGWFLGGSLAYQLSDLDSDHDLTSPNGNSVMGGAILKRQTGPLLLSVAVDAGYGWYDSERDIDLATRTEKGQGLARRRQCRPARAAYEVPFERWYLRPSLDLGGDYVRIGSFRRARRLALQSRRRFRGQDDLQRDPECRAGHAIDLADGSTLRPHLDLGFTAASANNWKPDARFTGEEGGNGFQIEAENPNLIGHLGVGIVMMTGAVDVTLQYGLDVASGYTANCGSLRVNYRF